MKTTIIILLSYVAILGNKMVLGVLPEAESPPFIYPNPVIPLPKNQDGNNNLPQGEEMQQQGGPQLTDDEKKCLVSFVNKGMSTCLEDIGNSFVTKKISVRPECCAALSGLQDACRLAVHFQNPSFEGAVQKYCSSMGAGGPAGSTTEAADGSGSEGGFGDGSFSDETGQIGDGYVSAFGPGPAEGPSSFGSLEGADGPGLAEGPETQEPNFF